MGGGNLFFMVFTFMILILGSIWIYYSICAAIAYGTENHKIKINSDNSVNNKWFPTLVTIFFILVMVNIITMIYIINIGV